MAENESDLDIVNIVIHGRGGQGAVTACEIIAEAAFLSDNFIDVHAYPSFGAERRGAPVQAYAKLSKKEKIWDRAQIEYPDIIIILDETVLNQNIASSLKKNGILIVNSDKEPEYFKSKYKLGEKIRIIIADVNDLALTKGLTIEGNPIVNTPILGLLLKCISEISIDNLIKAVQNKMDNTKIADLNIELIKEVYSH
jgi:2-oxoacid:acceptor oxidoreductase gamma subunit (pyruvate/2-ketoisovalerate family)